MFLYVLVGISYEMNNTIIWFVCASSIRLSVLIAAQQWRYTFYIMLMTLNSTHVLLKAHNIITWNLTLMNFIDIYKFDRYLYHHEYLIFMQ